MTNVGLDDDNDGSAGQQIVIQSSPNVVAQEVNEQIATAKRFPRPPMGRIIQEAVEATTYVPKVAEDCIYTLSRRNKNGEQIAIVGPSIRFAEVMQYCYRNLRIQAEFVRIDSSRADKVCVVAMCGVMDLERNIGVSVQVTRPAMTSSGRIYSGDMMSMTINAAQSIAMRNAILKIVPKAIWGGVYDAVVATIEGDPKTLPNRRAVMFSRFKEIGVTPDRILRVLGVDREEKIRLADMPRLAGMYAAIKDGEDPDDVFGRNTIPEETKTATGNPLADVPAGGAAGGVSAGRAADAHGPNASSTQPSDTRGQAASGPVRGASDETIYGQEAQAKRHGAYPAGGEAEATNEDDAHHGAPDDGGEPSGEGAPPTATQTPAGAAAASKAATPAMTLEEMIEKIKACGTNGALINWWKSVRAIREEMDDAALKTLDDVYKARSKEILDAKNVKAPG